MNKKLYILVIILSLVAIFLCVTVLFKFPGRISFHNNEKQYDNNVFEETKPEVPTYEKKENKRQKENVLSGHFDGLSGNIQYGIKFFGEDSEIIVGEGAVASASVIKLFIMEYIYTGSAEEGKEIPQSVKDTVRNMIIYSDNDSTNILIDKYGFENINSFIRKSGYKDTVLQRKMLDEKARKNGIDNFTSAKDVMMFLEKLYNNREVYPYSEMLEIMKSQTRKNKIPALLPEGVTVANKTGEHDNVENDAGIIFSESGDVALVFLCTDISDKGYAQSLIADAALKVYNAIKKPM